MEVIVDLLNLSQVLVLHLSPGYALLAGFMRIWEQHLVNNNVVNVDLLLGQFNG